MDKIRILKFIGGIIWPHILIVMLLTIPNPLIPPEEMIITYLLMRMGLK